MYVGSQAGAVGIPTHAIYQLSNDFGQNKTTVLLHNFSIIGVKYIYVMPLVCFG